MFSIDGPFPSMKLSSLLALIKSLLSEPAVTNTLIFTLLRPLLSLGLSVSDVFLMVPSRFFSLFHFSNPWSLKLPCRFLPVQGECFLTCLASICLHPHAPPLTPGLLIGLLFGTPSPRHSFSRFLDCVTEVPLYIIASPFPDFFPLKLKWKTPNLDKSTDLLSPNLTSCK